MNIHCIYTRKVDTIYKKDVYYTHLCIIGSLKTLKNSHSCVCFFNTMNIHPYIGIYMKLDIYAPPGRIRLNYLTILTIHGSDDRQNYLTILKIKLSDKSEN